ncbi:MAG: class I SAM-dependent methyltransferase [Chloroflexi bacterium]|nr:class I SAM-dependent methyltransferase [Chloroflexota bacterium]
MHPDEYEKMFRVEDTHWWFAGKRRLVRVMLEGLSPQAGRRILDVGCGTGGMFSLLREFGWLTGADASELATGFAARRGLAALERAALPELPFASGMFDLVTAFDVLYHRRVDDDQAALIEIARVLKPGGRFIATDSALKFLRGAHDDAVQGARRYTTGEMREKLSAAGFSVRRLSYANMLIFPLAAPWRLLRRRTGDEHGSDVSAAPGWLNALMGLVYRVEAGLLARTNLPVGMSIIVHAQKA